MWKCKCGLSCRISGPIVERLADAWGRQLRYGDGPVAPDTVEVSAPDAPFTRAFIWDVVLRESEVFANYERMVADDPSAGDARLPDGQTLTQALRSSMDMLAQVTMSLAGPARE